MMMMYEVLAAPSHDGVVVVGPITVTHINNSNIYKATIIIVVTKGV
jgi:hypothetical protein